jgi:hypothetical protein
MSYYRTELITAISFIVQTPSLYAVGNLGQYIELLLKGTAQYG